MACIFVIVLLLTWAFAIKGFGWQKTYAPCKLSAGCFLKWLPDHFILTSFDQYSRWQHTPSKSPTPFSHKEIILTPGLQVEDIPLCILKHVTCIQTPCWLFQMAEVFQEFGTFHLKSPFIAIFVCCFVCCVVIIHYAILCITMTQVKNNGIFISSKWPLTLELGLGFWTMWYPQKMYNNQLLFHWVFHVTCIFVACEYSANANSAVVLISCAPRSHLSSKVSDGEDALWHVSGSAHQEVCGAAGSVVGRRPGPQPGRRDPAGGFPGPRETVGVQGLLQN